MAKSKLVPPAKVIPLDDATCRRVEMFKRIDNQVKLIAHIKLLTDIWESSARELLEELTAECREGRKQC
jgi:hypothetical protein